MQHHTFLLLYFELILNFNTFVKLIILIKKQFQIESVKKICPKDYILVGSQCFKALHNTPVTWKTAKSLCKNIGGELATLSNLKPFSNLLNKLGLEGSSTYWIGGKVSTSDFTDDYINSEDKTNMIEDQNDVTIDSIDHCLALDTTDILGVSSVPCGRYYVPLCQPDPLYSMFYDQPNEILAKG